MLWGTVSAGFYPKYLREAEKSITVEALKTEFLAIKTGSAGRPIIRTISERDSGTLPRGSNSRWSARSHQLETWLHDLRLAPQSFNNYRPRVSSLFGYGVKRGYLERNTVSVFDKMKCVDQPPGISRWRNCVCCSIRRQRI